MIKRLKELRQKATPGPWKYGNNGGCKAIKGGKFGDHKQAQYHEILNTVGLFDEDEDKANAALIVEAVNNLDKLIAVCEAAKEAVTYRGEETREALEESLAALEEE